MPVPSLATGQILVQTKAAALNHLDLFVIRGLPGAKPSLPHILGSDGAGKVAKLAEDIDGFKIGDRVMLNPSLWCGQCEQCARGEDSLCDNFQIVGEHTPGTFAEYFAVPHQNLCKIPKGIGYKEAAGFSLVHLTSWRLLLTRANLQKGESILIHGIGGGVATAALGIAKLAGATPIIVTSSSDSKLQSALDLGADYCLNYNSTDLTKKVRFLTAGRGVDVIVDCVGSATWLQSLKMAAKGGTIVTCGATTGPNPETEIRLIFWKQLSILGSTMGTSEEYRKVVAHLSEGKLAPVIASVFRLDQGRKALNYLSNNQQFGKVILNIP